MKKALLIVCAVVCSVFYVAAQQYQDVVYLKNGSVVRGIILEQIPGKSLKIQTAGGSQFVYQMAEVEKMTKEAVNATPNQSTSNVKVVAKAPKTKKVVDWKPKYKGEVNVGYAITGEKFKFEDSWEDSEGDYGNEILGKYTTVLSRPLFETIHGVEIGPYFFIGAGVGLQYYCGKLKDFQFLADEAAEINQTKPSERWNAVMMPIFADIKFMLPVNDKFIPFVNLGLGGTVGLYSSANYKDEGSADGGYDSPDIQYSLKQRVNGGFYCDFGAGFRYKAFNFSFGLQHQVLKLVSKGEAIGDGSYTSKETISTKVNAFYVKLGVNF